MHTASRFSSVARINIGDITLYLVCQGGHGAGQTPHLLQVTGCVLYSDLGSDKSYAQCDFWSSILQLPSLRALIIGLKDIDALKTWAEENPELQQLDGHRLRYYRLAVGGELPRPEPTGGWIGRDPSSFDSTGTSTLVEIM